MTRNRHKAVLRWTFRTLLLAILLVMLWLSIPAFPYPFFTHRYQYEYCTVYSDSPLDSDFDDIISNFNKRLEASPLYDRDKNNRIFLSHSRKLFGFYTKVCLLNPSIQGFNLSILGNTFVSVPRVNDMFESTGGIPRYGIRDGDLSHVLAHELTHQYIEDEIGFIRTNRLPLWKLEGYTEYGAHIGFIREDSTATLENRIDGLLEIRYWNDPDGYARNVYKGELMVEYLSEIKGYSLSEIMDDSVTYEDTYDKLMEWYEDNR